MAESKVTTVVVPLNGTNYPTWKVQCKMALMKDGLWEIVTEKEVAPEDTTTNEYTKFIARRNRALATIVLTVDPTLLYLIGEPDSPVTVWKKLADQFQKKTWANKLVLRRKLYSLKLKDGDSVHKHVKSMTEIFNELSVIGVEMTEEDRVVHLLASLPESYNTLVTALEASPDVPKMDVVTEKLLYEESRLKDRGKKEEEALPTKHKFGPRRGPRCHFCHKFGHIQRNCAERARPSEKKREEFKGKEDNKMKHKVNQVNARSRSESNSDSSFVGLVTRLVLSASTSHQSTDTWIVDSGATCHICNNKQSFIQYQTLKKPQEVSVGDGYTLEAIGRGVVVLTLDLPDNQTRKCKLHEVLYVPKLTYNLLSVSKMTDAGKHITFCDDKCLIYNEKEKLVAVATESGSLYYLNCRQSTHEQINAIWKQQLGSKESIWHRRFGHLGEISLRELAKNNLVSGFDYNLSNDINFCESCVIGKLHRSSFPTTGRKRADTVLNLVHSDACGKMSTQSLGGAEYFLTFIDHITPGCTFSSTRVKFFRNSKNGKLLLKLHLATS